MILRDPSAARIERARVAYFAALRTCPASGAGVHAWVLGAANRAALAGIPAAQAASEIEGAMTRPPAPRSEVRDAVAKAYREHDDLAAAAASGLPIPPKREKPKPNPAAAAEFIRRGGGAGEAEMWEASPVRMFWGDDWRQDACAVLRALFRPGELVFCGGTHDRDTIRPRDEWIDLFEHGGEIPPFLCVNPLKAEGGTTAGGTCSRRCDDAVSAFRHAVVEFDGMPLADQFAFWAGWGLDAVTAVTFSGSKSLHALLRVDCKSREEWERDVRGCLFERHLIPLGCDGTCRNPSRLSRLAGARRADKGGAVQKLWFVREELAA
jgi:hypothetical protein